MRKVITGAFVSLDGVMQAPGGPQEDPSGEFKYGGWVAPLIDDACMAEIDQLFAAPFDLLLGRKTYEIFAAHWPYQHDDDPIAKRFNAVTKYVATRSDMPLTWQHSVALHDAAADVARLKRENGPALVTQGSSNLIQTLLAHDLIDELRVLTFPVVLGRGKRLFSEGGPAVALKLIESRSTPNGITISVYHRAGAVAVGDFAMDPPSEAEVRRRETMRHESRER